MKTNEEMYELLKQHYSGRVLASKRFNLQYDNHITIEGRVYPKADKKTWEVEGNAE